MTSRHFKKQEAIDRIQTVKSLTHFVIKMVILYTLKLKQIRFYEEWSRAIVGDTPQVYKT